MNNKAYRIEKDSIGEFEVPANALYGSQTARSHKVFKITNKKMDKDFIVAFAQFKKAAAIANNNVGNLNDKISHAIIQSCDELIKNVDKYKKEFVTDRVQGGAGTSVNMNVNEVLANMATLKLNGKLGEYIVHPNDHVNMGQSTNDAFPTSAKITLITKLNRLNKIINKFEAQLRATGKKYNNLIKLGRTHLQDAVPMVAGSVFTQWADSLQRDKERINFSMKHLSIINMGSTAIGTGINQKKKYIQEVDEVLSDIVGFDLHNASNLIDGTRNTDVFSGLSSALKILSLGLSKNCNDLRLMASGPKSGLNEIILPSIQPGSSIMPGKVNPVIPEVINQISFLIHGFDLTVSRAVEAGQMELNVFEPVIFSVMFDEIDYLGKAMKLLVRHVLKDIKFNVEQVQKNLDNSSAFATAFISKYGYEKVSKIVKSAVFSSGSVKQALIDGLGITEKEYKEITDIKNVISC